MGRARVRMRWFGKEMERDLKKEMGKRLKAAGEMARSQIVENISESTRTLGPSLPGEYPHRNLGDLARSYFVGDVDKERMEVIVGSMSKVAAYLEDGTSHMDPRPHLLRTFEEMRQRLAKFLTRPIKGVLGYLKGSR